MMGMEELVGEEYHPLAHSDPVVFELNRLQNQLKEKDKELGIAQKNIKALRATEVLKDKAIEQLTNEFHNLDKKLMFAEKLLDQKNLEIKKLTSDKKEALAAQFAAEATLRRVHANQKDDNSVPIESVIAPLEAEIKMYKNEIVALQEDKKALERLTKSKETALLEAEKILRSALERALVVEEVQNHNFVLKRQIEICQEENRILEKTNRQKVLEVEKLSETIKELEEDILAGAAAANAVRDYQRQLCELNEEKRTLERELARVKVSANRVATVVANEWKDENDKVMPVKQWLEQRRLLQAEMQRLRDKLVISERTAKAEAQIKDKLKMRLKTLEEGLKNVSPFSISPNAFRGSPKPEKSTHTFGFLSTNNGQKKRSTSQPRTSGIWKRSPLQQPNLEDETTIAAGEPKEVNNLKKKHGSGENFLRRSLWASRSKVVDSGEKENKEMSRNSLVNVDTFEDNETAVSGDITINNAGNEASQIKESENDDMVSGFLYDRLQKEVITLRRFCEVKDSTLNTKDEEIKMLVKKVDTMTKAIEVESKKMKREASTREKESVSAKMDNHNKVINANA
ncbi:microtubule-associated protein 70-5 [Rhododendron vialii]|uniref:microtubule-associated protein 70-5 n=1 Tax=Rhododendron vialii TaxID=182163 RepID=UPI00265EACA9|nr:microtubule-associated protein 70-5 [Rhododendron vialii]